MKNSTINVKLLCQMAFFIALSMILANFKIFGTVALDSMPAFLAAILINPLAGAIVGALGHLFTALTSGFPLTIAMHLVIALEMFVVVYVFGIIYKKHIIGAIVVGVILNGPVSTLIAGIVAQILIGGMTYREFFLLMVIPLTIATIINIILACILGRVLKHVSI